MRQKFYHINDELLVKYLLGEATPAEMEAVVVWIDTDAANRKHYEDFKKIWDESRSLALKTNVNEDAAWNRFKEKRLQSMPAKPLVKRLHPISWLRIAALFIITLGIAYAAYRILSPDEIENKVVLSRNTPLVDTLTDGSVVTLNKNARLHYPSKFTGNSRVVALEGEAFFNVTPNKEKPFIITVKDISITVVGTSFNVSSKNGMTEIIVETGIVRVKKTEQGGGVKKG